MSYTRFIILGQARTGSNFVRGLLDTHSNVFICGELFHPTKEIRETIAKVSNLPTLLDGDDPIEYLENYVYKIHPDSIKAVGFKLFYEHARNDTWKRVWVYLSGSDIKVIHAKRRNLLDRYLSLQLAFRSQEWILWEKQDTRYGPITLDPRHCYQDFHQTLRQEKESDDFFKDKPKIEVIYEDLSDNLAEESRRIQDFLGLAHQTLSTKTRKQRTQKKSDIIANYAQLKSVLVQGLAKGKEWAKEEWLEFFEEEKPTTQPVPDRRRERPKFLGEWIKNSIGQIINRSSRRKMNYTRFIILGQGRTGSNLLLSLLASHRNVFSVGEVFNPAEEIRKTARIAKPLTLDDDPIEYLENYVYKTHPDHIKAVGFKLFYDHARNDEWKKVWEYLRRSRVKIMHLKRKNLLDRYLSYQLADRSNMWINFEKGNNAVNEPITLNPQDCFKDFHATLRRQEQANDFFKDNPVLEVIYEELVSDFAGESRRLLAFLGLGYQELTATTRKQRTRKKPEIIANYDQLKNVLVQGLAKGEDWAKEEWLEFFAEE